MQPWPFCTQPANSGAPGTGDTKLIVSVRSNQAQAQAAQVLLCKPTPVVPSKVGTPAVLAACFNRSQSGTKRPSWPTLHLATQPTPRPFHLRVPETWHPNQGCCLPCNVVIFFPEAIYSTVSDEVLASIFHAGVSLLHKTPVFGTQLILACAWGPTVSGSSADIDPLSLFSALDPCLRQQSSGTAVKP